MGGQEYFITALITSICHLLSLVERENTHTPQSVPLKSGVSISPRALVGITHKRMHYPRGFIYNHGCSTLKCCYVSGYGKLAFLLPDVLRKVKTLLVLLLYYRRPSRNGIQQAAWHFLMRPDLPAHFYSGIFLTLRCEIPYFSPTHTFSSAHQFW